LDYMRAIPRKPPALMAALIVAITMLPIAGCMNASISVKSGESIQSAINAAMPGDLIEVQSGTYEESIVIDKPLTLHGIDSGSGIPVVETDKGSAIVLKANGIVLQGFGASSASGWSEDAGILVASSNNILRNNAAKGCGNAGILLQESRNNSLLENLAQGNGNDGISLRNCSSCLLEGNQADSNKYGLRMVNSNKNAIRGNTFQQNRFDAVYLQDSQGNIIENNYARGNSGGVNLETSRDNIVRKNDLVNNELGISIAYHDDSKGVTAKGKGVSISYNAMPSEDLVNSNNTLYLNNLSNEENAYDDGLNYWDNGKMGNNYSDFNDANEGCTGSKICSSGHRITGGHSVDEFPIAAPRKIAGQSSGPGGAFFHILRSSFLPGSKIRLNYTAPSNVEVWAGVGNAKEGDLFLGQNISGNAIFTAPEREGAYKLVMHDGNGTEIMSLPFNVTVPRITASPSNVGTCEKISVAFSGASGQKNDMIGMYGVGSSDAVSKQYLGGKNNGSITFSSTGAGNFEFKMFEAGSNEPSVLSGPVEVVARSGIKVIAEPSQVSPGGTITVTYWGAPSSGTGVLGMYGVNRPDKFHVEKRPIGSKPCGSMTFRARGPGQYDFRLFGDDIRRPLLGQSNVVMVK
jgi:nitrous oxidase accessory protein